MKLVLRYNDATWTIALIGWDGQAIRETIYATTNLIVAYSVVAMYIDTYRVVLEGKSYENFDMLSKSWNAQIKAIERKARTQ